MTILLFITWHKNNFIAGIVYQISQHSTPRQQCTGPVSALAVQLIQEEGSVIHCEFNTPTILHKSEELTLEV